MVATAKEKGGQMVALLAGDQHGANGAVARAAMSLTQVPCTCDPATKRERGVRPRPTRAADYDHRGALQPDRGAGAAARQEDSSGHEDLSGHPDRGEPGARLPAGYAREAGQVHEARRPGGGAQLSLPGGQARQDGLQGSCPGGILYLSSGRVTAANGDGGPVEPPFEKRPPACGRSGRGSLEFKMSRRP